jgi:hypothetical protein
VQPCNKTTSKKAIAPPRQLIPVIPRTIYVLEQARPLRPDRERGQLPREERRRDVAAARGRAGRLLQPARTAPAARRSTRALMARRSSFLEPDAAVVAQGLHGTESQKQSLAHALEQARPLRSRGERGLQRLRNDVEPPRDERRVGVRRVTAEREQPRCCHLKEKQWFLAKKKERKTMQR